MQGFRTVAAALVWMLVLSMGERSLSLENPVGAFENRVGDCVALFFTKPQCPACRAVQGAVERAVQAGWAIRTLQGPQEASLVARWHIEKYPTVVLMRNGREVDRLIGEPKFEELVRRMLAASSVDSIRVVANTRSDSLVRGQSPPAVVPLAGSVPIATSSVVPASHAVAAPLSATAPTLATAPPSVSAIPSVSATASDRMASRPPSNPAEATVRIRVDEPQHEAIGTGTIIDTYQGEALVLTCGHLFRDTQGSTRILVETFVGGQPRTYAATLIDYRADEADIGLISFRPEGVVPTARLMDHREKLREGEAVYSWGCDHGNNPSRRDSRITKLNRYLGAPNVEVYGAPVQGRSGGGLFNARGELIGVCYAADNELNEGLYNAPEVVYQQLMRLGLNRLFSHPAPDSLANHESIVSPSSAPASLSNASVSPSMAAVPPSMAAVPPTMASETQRPKLTVLLEGNGQNQRWEIQDPTPDLVQTLQNQAVRR